jgi:hypothetical protein
MLVGCLAMAISCTSDFESVNTNKNNVASIGPLELPFLFSKALSVAPNVGGNYQIAQNLHADQYAQYFACISTGFGSDRLVPNQNWVGAAFNPMYSEVLPQLQTIFQQTEETSAEYQLASIWWVFTFHRVTDYWGPIPYFKAGESGLSVEYDSQEDIYDDFFKRLTTAVNTLKTYNGAAPYGNFDTVFKGDVSKWIKFANTLRLRLALRISKVDAARAKTEAEAAVAAGVMVASPGDDALVARSQKGGDNNGLSIMQWGEFRMSATMESVLKGYSDPRMEQYYLPAASSGEYEGVRNGLTSAQISDVSGKNAAPNTSQQGPRWSPGGGDYLATPQNIMCTAEAYFLRAEGVLNNWNMGGGTAKQYYEEGIRQSFAQWGVGSADAYIADATSEPIAPNDFLNSPPVSDLKIAWGATDAIQREQVATQKWIALFPEAMEAWADYRRNPIVKLYPVANSNNPLITDPATQHLRRIPFLTSEKATNAPGVATGEAKLGGPDNTQTPLWWDKN